MIRRFQISLRLALVAVLMIAVSLGLLRVNTTLHSLTLGLIGFISLAVNVGWPLGFLVGGRRGAVLGGVLGIIFLFGGLFVYSTIAFRNTPDF
jgi:hypothetical protein